MKRYKIKKQKIIEYQEMIVQASTQEELVIKYNDLLNELHDEGKEERTVKHTYLVTELAEADAEIFEGIVENGKVTEKY